MSAGVPDEIVLVDELRATVRSLVAEVQRLEGNMARADGAMDVAIKALELLAAKGNIKKAIREEAIRGLVEARNERLFDP
jgi:hypothetical protein